LKRYKPREKIPKKRESAYNEEKAGTIPSPKKGTRASSIKRNNARGEPVSSVAGNVQKNSQAEKKKREQRLFFAAGFAEGIETKEGRRSSGVGEAEM